MTVARAHTQLSNAIRALTFARNRLQTGRLSWFGRLIYRYRCAFLDSQIRQLVHQLHSSSSSSAPLFHK